MSVPVALFTYNRPNHLRRTLDSLRENDVPQIFAFSDGPRSAEAGSSVAEVRRMLHEVDWCEMVVCERPQNLGLGRSIRDGVGQVLANHSAVMVYEDDLICVPGAYRYLAAALEHYRDDDRVMSVTGWTHPRITPSDVKASPYFDGRAECLVWGTWARAWEGMDQSALQIMEECKRRGIDIFRYGADLPAMAEIEQKKNIWAVRWLFLHILHGGLCLRPPHSLVEHIGFDPLATNASDGQQWSNPPLQPCPPVPTNWPPALENKECPALWRREYGGRPNLRRRIAALRDVTRRRGVGSKVRWMISLVTPPLVRMAYVRLRKPRKQAVAEWEYVPGGWRTAKANPLVKGWNVVEVLASHKSRWETYTKWLSATGPFDVSPEAIGAPRTDVGFHNTLMSYAYALALVSRQKLAMSILDWGGGLGQYYLLSQRLLPDLKIEYHCKDVPMLAEYGQSLWPDARFYADDSCLTRKYDLVLASGSLHYTEDWKDLLSSLARASAGHLFVTRLPTILNAKSYTFVQRPYAYGYNTEYLGWCLNREELLQQASASGLRLLREFVTGEQPVIENAPEQCLYRGFLFEQAAVSKETS